MVRIDGLCKCCHVLFRKYIGKRMKSQCFKLGMRLFVSLLNAFPFYVVNYEMLEWMENKMDLYLYKVIFNLVMIMTLISYYTASFRKIKEIP